MAIANSAERINIADEKFLILQLVQVTANTTEFVIESVDEERRLPIKKQHKLKTEMD